MKNQNQKSKRRNQDAKSKSEGNDPAHVTDATFDSIIKETPVVLIDFWADWCGPCGALAPKIEELAVEYRGKVFVGKLDVDKNPITSDRFKVSSVPTVIIFENGKKAARIVGCMSKKEIDSALKKTLDKTEEEPEKRRGMKTRLLFVCSGNVNRSALAEAMFQSDGRYEAKSCGINDDAPVQLSRDLLEWADIVFAMQGHHKEAVHRLMPRVDAKTRVLQVPDIYEYGDPVLVEVLEEELRIHGITVVDGVLEGKCECGGSVVVASDGERACQDCGAIYGRSIVQSQRDRNPLPCDYWSGSGDNQQRQLETDVERRGWG